MNKVTSYFTTFQPPAPAGLRRELVATARTDATRPPRACPVGEQGHRLHHNPPITGPCRLARRASRHSQPDTTRPPRACPVGEQGHKLHHNPPITGPCRLARQVKKLFTRHMKSSPHAFHLRYSWTAWPSAGTSLPTDIRLPVAEWKRDGLNILEQRIQPTSYQLVVSANPHSAPIEITRVLKGRLQHSIRSAKLVANFSRKVSLRSVGDNTRATVEAYIRNQLAHADLADERYRDALKQHTFSQPDIDLAQPFETNSGRYWYNLHIVLVTDSRSRMSDQIARRVSDACKLPFVAKCAVMPDHLHVAAKADPAKNPESLARELQAKTAAAAGMAGFWKDTFYVGTFSEYSMKAVRG